MVLKWFPISRRDEQLPDKLVIKSDPISLRTEQDKYICVCGGDVVPITFSIRIRLHRFHHTWRKELQYWSAAEKALKSQQTAVLQQLHNLDFLE